MSGDIRNGILQAPSLSLRDWLAGLAMQTCLLTALGAEDDETSLPMVPKAAYAVADMMLVARDNAAAEVERQKRLAAIGEFIVRQLKDGETRDAETSLQTALTEYFDAYHPEWKTSPTEPAPPPDDAPLGPNDVHEDVGLAVAVPDAEAARLVGASRNGDGT